jgi:hypothetical protein
LVAYLFRPVKIIINYLKIIKSMFKKNGILILIIGIILIAAVYFSYHGFYKATPVVSDPLKASCLASGGTVLPSVCCETSSDFPNSCAISACGCSPENSREIQTCVCPAGQCFDGSKCLAQSLPLKITIYCTNVNCAPNEIAAGAGTLIRGCFRTLDECDADWKIYSDAKNNFQYKYPANLAVGANVWRMEFWPAKTAVFATSGNPIIKGCPDLSSNGETGKALIMQKVTLNGIDFSYATSSDVGAGQLYTTYCYLTQKNSKYYALEFVSHSHTGCFAGECGAYCGTANEQECRNFDLKRDVEIPIRAVVLTFSFIN